MKGRLCPRAELSAPALEHEVQKEDLRELQLLDHWPACRNRAPYMALHVIIATKDTQNNTSC